MMQCYIRQKSDATLHQAHGSSVPLLKEEKLECLIVKYVQSLLERCVFSVGRVIPLLLLKCGNFVLVKLPWQPLAHYVEQELDCGLTEDQLVQFADITHATTRI